MSDTEDGPDDFDKEAEREKLREKYEQDRKRREATQHMSELLLKGATMTNAHCDECGSPVFRYEGEEFCPTCAGTRDVVEGETAGTVADRDADAAGATPGDATTDPGQQDAGGPPDAPAGPPESAAGGGGDAATDDGDDEPVDGRDLEAARARLEDRAGSRPSDVGGSTDRRSDPPLSSDSPVRQGEVPSMAQTRASLRRAIVSLSEQAAQSDDPGRAHNLLKGAREASEALAALEGTTGE